MNSHMEVICVIIKQQHGVMTVELISDIRYYFDIYKEKCIKDSCTNNNGGDDKKGGDGGGLKAWHIVMI